MPKPSDDVERFVEKWGNNKPYRLQLNTEFDDEMTADLHALLAAREREVREACCRALCSACHCGEAVENNPIQGWIHTNDGGGWFNCGAAAIRRGT